MTEYAAQWNTAIVMPNCVIFNFAFSNSSQIGAWAGFMHIENIGNTITTGLSAQGVICNAVNNSCGIIYGITSLTTGRSTIYAKSDIPAGTWHGQLIIY